MTTVKGRGATGNAGSGRFNLPARTADRDWLDERESIDGASPKLRTEITIRTRAHDHQPQHVPDIGFNQSINAYRGCEQAYTVALRQ